MSTKRIQRAGDQEAVARHLIETVRRRFAGEDAAMARAVGWEPDERVVIGILDPREPRFPPPSHPDLPEEPGVPVDVLPPSELGVTVWVELPAGSTHAHFDVDVSFSVYLPEYPTWDEQQAWATGRPRDASHDQLQSAHNDPHVDGVHSANEEPQTGVSNAARGTDGPNSSEHSSRQYERLAPVFVRRNIQTTISLVVPLAAATVTDDGVLQAVLTETITSNPSRLAYELRGRAKRSISRAALDSGAVAYEAEISERRTNQLPSLPTVEFLASTKPDPRGGWRIHLTLANATEATTRRDKPTQTVYNAQFSAQLRHGQYRNFGYRLSDLDWRTEPHVYAHGRFCVGEVQGNTVRTNTWPIYRDRIFESVSQLQPEFKDLIDNPIGVLKTIATRMDEYANEWHHHISLNSIDEPRLTACNDDLDAFLNESQRFRQGIQLLRSDANLLTAFVETNRAFLLQNTPDALNPDSKKSSTEPDISSWRLFQIVFIVCGLAGLAAREHPDDDLAEELTIADVIWFPTGGGKSEAFFGLIAIALFYDRLRGKHFGTSAVVRFPLRMLSVQQLDRILRLIAACEHVRLSQHGQDGEPFELGYFVGRNNTPNSLTHADDDRWGDIHRMSEWTAEQRRGNVVVTTCPFCGSDAIELSADVARVRLDHWCTDCRIRIPVVISDDEIYRTLPAVIVATVDKLATIAFQPHFSHLTHGPEFRCASHGYVTFAKSSNSRQRCLGRDLCDSDPSEWERIHCYDPAPAIIIQDELHLLAEELGTLNAHYETLFAHLCKAGAGLPPKIVAATATISDYENQITQLYALRPRRFPSDGFRDGETFYASRQDITRRLFVGALPTRLDTTEFCIDAAKIWRQELDRIRLMPHNHSVAMLGLGESIDSASLAELLFRYELQLVYLNRKNDAERAHEQLRRSGNRGPSFFQAELLSGDTPLADISAAIRRISTESLTTTPDPAERLAAIAGTSLVSHGIDLSRLNGLFVSGLPPTNAYYVQATSRAGRTDVGVVFSAYSRYAARDRAAFHFFEPHHTYASQLVEAVSLNRFAVHSPKKTATGVLSAVIMNRLARDTTLNPINDNQLINMMYASEFRAWLSTQPARTDSDLIDEVLLAYGLESHVLDPTVADYFSDSVRTRLIDELSQLRAGIQLTIQKSFLNKPPTSFRDIDESVEFAAFGAHSRRDFATLTGRGHRAEFVDSEAPIVSEQEETH